jgi:hypothetical protein
VSTSKRSREIARVNVNVAFRHSSVFFFSAGYPRYCTATTLPDGTTVLNGGRSRRGKPRGPPGSRELQTALKGCDDPLFLDFIRHVVVASGKNYQMSLLLRQNYQMSLLLRAEKSNVVVASAGLSNVASADNLRVMLLRAEKSNVVVASAERSNVVVASGRTVKCHCFISRKPIVIASGKKYQMSLLLRAEKSNVVVASAENLLLLLRQKNQMSSLLRAEKSNVVVASVRKIKCHCFFGHINQMLLLLSRKIKCRSCFSRKIKCRCCFGEKNQMSLLLRQKDPMSLLLWAELSNVVVASGRKIKCRCCFS